MFSILWATCDEWTFPSLSFIFSNIIKGSANLFSLCLTLKVTLFKIQNNVCRQGPFEIVPYTDEQLGNINGFQKANGGNKIHPEDSEIFVDIYPQNAYFSNNNIFLHLLNTQFYGTSTLNN